LLLLPLDALLACLDYSIGGGGNRLEWTRWYWTSWASIASIQMGIYWAFSF